MVRRPSIPTDPRQHRDRLGPGAVLCRLEPRSRFMERMAPFRSNRYRMEPCESQGGCDERLNQHLSE